MATPLERSLFSLSRQSVGLRPPRQPKDVRQRLEFVAKLLRDLGEREAFHGPTLIWRGDSGLAEAMTVNRPIVIGRAPNCDLVFDHPSVSRWHAEVAPDDENESLVHLRDLNSSAGTRLNGRPVELPIVLRDGDVVEAGSAAFAFLSARGRE